MALRELNLDGVPEQQRNWINDHTVYTHGFGFVAALGEETTDGGRPSFVSSDIPPIGRAHRLPAADLLRRGVPDLQHRRRAGVGRARLPGRLGAVGHPQHDVQGRGRRARRQPVQQAAVRDEVPGAQPPAVRPDQADSKILYVRDPKERVEKVAPWLTLDGDPYPVVADGRIQWIVDGYTTSNGFPYSTRSTLGDVTADSRTTAATGIVTPVDQVNYIRNSVKATVDAYDGTVTLYEWDDEDPVLKTWKKAFPGTVKPRSAISDELLTHLRYPEDLFKVQRTLLANYHVQNPQTFYNGSDFWRIPDDPTRPPGRRVRSRRTT